MKKLLFLSLAIILSLIGCSKEEQSSVQPTQIKFDFKVNNETKAVKSAFTEGDVIYIFLEGISGNKYLTVTKNSAGDWETELGGDITMSEVASLSSGAMYGIYFPFDNVAIESDGEEGVTFRSSGHSNPALNGIPIYTYYMKGNSTFSVATSGGITIVSGSITLTIPDDFVQFFIAKNGSKFAQDDQYRLSVAGMKPVALTSFSNGIFTETELEASHPVWGYLYNNEGVSFTGKIDASWASAQDHRFILFDDNGTVANPAKATIFSGKTLSSHAAVKLSNVGMWSRAIAEPNAVTLGSTQWADRNLGATTEDDRGLYFAYMFLVGSDDTHRLFEYYTSGANCPAYWGGNYLKALSPWGAMATRYAYLDLTTDLSIYDAARAYLGSDWRIPNATEFTDLVTNYKSEQTTWNTSYGKGNCSYLFTDGTNSIVIPLTGGWHTSSDHLDWPNAAEYQTTQRASTKQYRTFKFGDTVNFPTDESFGIGTLSSIYRDDYFAFVIIYGARENGFPIRPVKAN